MEIALRSIKTKKVNTKNIYKYFGKKVYVIIKNTKTFENKFYAV